MDIIFNTKKDLSTVQLNARLLKLFTGHETYEQVHNIRNLLETVRGEKGTEGEQMKKVRYTFVYLPC